MPGSFQRPLITTEEEAHEGVLSISRFWREVNGPPVRPKVKNGARGAQAFREKWRLIVHVEARLCRRADLTSRKWSSGKSAVREW
jgi:hypothetical protein